MYKVAKHFEVPYSSLYDIFVTRGSYNGKGRKSTVFTLEEEKDISRRALENSNNGSDLTWTMLKDVLEKEVEMLMSTNPRRDTFRVSATKGSLLNINFVRRFAKRNALMKYHIKKPNGTHECEKCKKTFSFKNALVKHLKTVHK